MLKCGFAHSNSDDFARWQQQLLDWSLGPATATQPQAVSMHHAPAQQQVPPADPVALIAMVASAMGVKMAEALKPLAAAATKQTETAIQHNV